MEFIHSYPSFKHKNLILIHPFYSHALKFNKFDREGDRLPFINTNHVTLSLVAGCRPVSPGFLFH